MALRVTVESNLYQLKALMDGTARQLPFALKVAINDTAKDFQRVETRQIMKVFTIRRRTFAKRAVKIKPFATKQKLEAKVSIDPPGGQARADIFAKFETPSIKRPRGSRIAVPKEVRRTKTGIISKAKRPRSFQFQRVGKALRGKQRTFLIKLPGGRGGIYQRTGPRGRKRGGRAMASTISTRKQFDTRIRTLYRFTPQAKIDDRLEFVDTGKKTVRAEFPKNFHQAFKKALATARRSDPKAKTISRQARRILRADVSGVGRGGG
jgi:hypothetical protein